MPLSNRSISLAYRRPLRHTHIIIIAVVVLESRLNADTEPG